MMARRRGLGAQAARALTAGRPATGAGPSSSGGCARSRWALLCLSWLGLSCAGKGGSASEGPAASAPGANAAAPGASAAASARAPGERAARVRTADPRIVPWSEQLALREAWLARRHELLLPMMRRHGVAMWVVLNEEFHDDPLTEFVAPPRPYAGNRDLFVFVDAGDEGLKRFALMGFTEEHVARFFETPAEPGKQKEALAALFARYQPRTIALNAGGARGVTRGLTYDGRRFLVEALGPAAERRFVAAAPLIEEYLDTRLPEEFGPYRAMVELTDEIVREALSSAVIAPGATRVGEVRTFLYDRLWALGLRTWFQPDLRVQRQGADGGTSRGFLAVAREDVIIERGDLVHVDFGLSYLGLHTDWQRMAYVLRDGEREAPEGLRLALADANALQDALARASRPGRPSAEVYEATMNEMRERGVAARIYSHPLGNQGHALGAGIDFRSGARGEPPKPLRLGSYLAMELSAERAVPEWGGQKVFAMQEDPVYLTDEGWRFFVPRQEAYYLVR